MRTNERYSDGTLQEHSHPQAFDHYCYQLLMRLINYTAINGFLITLEL